MRTVPLYPVFLRLSGRRCLVVGGGRVAERKARGLLGAGAAVTVVAPAATAGIRRLARAKAIRFLERPFRPSDLRGVRVAVCATGDAAVNARAAAEGRRRGALVNAADDPARCDFFLPAVMRRGGLVIAVSTGGGSPALAAAVRRDLERRYGAEYGAIARVARDLRARSARARTARDRRRLRGALVSPAMLRIARRSGAAAARRRAARLLAAAADGGPRPPRGRR
ncbi:MAG: bifunctional precorrin-2 dehydrogenase/sirohydrochlorin ferrochelatase [bacterium]|nr:bifunctional precorrin-2 dehydrogenase/sirohydrochlorin ferrochelatase [bacterium]